MWIKWVEIWQCLIPTTHFNAQIYFLWLIGRLSKERRVGILDFKGFWLIPPENGIVRTVLGLQAIAKIEKNRYSNIPDSQAKINFIT